MLCEHLQKHAQNVEHHGTLDIAMRCQAAFFCARRPNTRIAESPRALLALPLRVLPTSMSGNFADPSEAQPLKRSRWKVVHLRRHSLIPKRCVIIAPQRLCYIHDNRILLKPRLLVLLRPQHPLVA